MLRQPRVLSTLKGAAKLPETMDIFGNRTGRIIDLFPGIEPADAKPQAGPRQILAKP